MTFSTRAASQREEWIMNEYKLEQRDIRDPCESYRIKETRLMKSYIIMTKIIKF